MMVVPRYIALRTSKPISAEHLKCWFRTVTEKAPSGVTYTLPSTDEHGMPQSVALIHRKNDGMHEYVVPLVRDLSDLEAEVIAVAFMGYGLGFDFDILTSAERLDIVTPDNHIGISQERFLQLGLSLAKCRHEDWVRDRTSAGWRYGTTVNNAAKTHPLLLPWDQVPDQARSPDLHSPQMVVNLLTDAGWAIVPKAELDKLNAKRRENPKD